MQLFLKRFARPFFKKKKTKWGTRPCPAQDTGGLQDSIAEYGPIPII